MLDCSAAHQAYLPIVAASTRASTLHYCCNDRAFAWGPVNPRDIVNTGNLSHAHPHDDHTEGELELLPQVLLIDAGCEWDCYNSDSKYLLYEILLVLDLGVDLVHMASSISSSLISHLVIFITVTRTMPVGNGGKFTEEAKKVYELVLRMQSVSYQLFAFVRHSYSDIPNFVRVGIVQDRCTWNALG